MTREDEGGRESAVDAVEWTRKRTTGDRGRSPVVAGCGVQRVGCMPCLLGGHFFLFAFHAHGFELALFGFVRILDFLLDLGCRFFELG